MTQTNGAHTDIAIIDIGSNSVRMVCYRVYGNDITITSNERKICALGQYLDQTGKLCPQGKVMTTDILKKFSAQLSENQITTLHIIATAAVREAHDGQEFIEDIKKQTGLDVQVLSGEQEALYSGYGVLSAFPDSHGLAGDLGGGSLELSNISDGKPSNGLSLPIGVLRLHPRQQDAYDHAIGYLKDIGDHYRQYNTFYAVGGSWRAVAEAHQYWKGIKDTHSHGYEVAASELRDFLEHMYKTAPDILMSEYGVADDRTKLIPYAVIALQALIDEIQFENIKFSNAGLRDGLLFTLARDTNEQKEINKDKEPA